MQTLTYLRKKKQNYSSHILSDKIKVDHPNDTSNFTSNNYLNQNNNENLGEDGFPPMELIPKKQNNIVSRYNDRDNKNFSILFKDRSIYDNSNNNIVSISNENSGDSSNSNINNQ